MPKYCCAPYCFNNNKDGKTKHFHLFPKEKSPRNEWKNRLNIEQAPKKHMVVCSEHFEKTDYIMSEHGQGDKELLKKGSVPKIVTENNNFVVESATTAGKFEELRDDIGADTIILDNSDNEFETSGDMIQLIQIPSEIKDNEFTEPIPFAVNDTESTNLSF